MWAGKKRTQWKRFDVRVSAFPLASSAIRWPFLKAWYKLYQRSLTARYTLPLAGVQNSVLGGDAAGVGRSDAYLAYKVRYYTGGYARIGQAKLWVKISPILYIGDMEQVDESNFDNVMQTLKSICRRLGIRLISSPYQPAYQPVPLVECSLCRCVPSFPVIFQDFGAALPLEKIKFTFADVDIF